MVFKAALLLLLLSPAAGAGTDPLSPPFWNLPDVAAEPSAAAPGLVRGETLRYNIYWGAIYVGSSYIKISGAVQISSRPAWHIVSETRSGSFLANFYRVADRNEAWMDAADFHSYGYYKLISEGRYFFNEWLVFDDAARRFYGETMGRDGKGSKIEGALPGPVNDALSAVYRLRAMPLEPGHTVDMDLNTKKNWRLSIKAEKREKISTPYGKKKCILFEPTLGGDGLFVSKAGRRMLVWITDDDLKLPMMMKAEIFIGSVTAKLVSRTVTP